jgi:hypothetical protein
MHETLLANMSVVYKALRPLANAAGNNTTEHKILRDIEKGTMRSYLALCEYDGLLQECFGHVIQNFCRPHVANAGLHDSISSSTKRTAT